ncbi:MAG TPA: 16S rRNA (adenine(1518)-N(6)/adenine(1519)-N(6))-dimethyltransferase RsmA [Candidatus Paceibacterota bacterium]|nr:16S rRNA (adenine(1518)-N(6)/adenine(1519)-N(6))-dimethyltransferase RsmA [Candidatus Paceibacterota bacterium]
MDLSYKKNIKNLLKSERIKPLKRLGQNFLADSGAIKKIIKAADLNSEDLVLEIGPGLGVLTKELVQKVKKVIAVEKDKNMVKLLKESLNNKNLEIIDRDILKFIPEFKNYKIVANLPFYLTAPVIRRFLEAINNPSQQMVLVVQKEVGQRICASPPKMSILAVSVQAYAKTEIVSYISRKSFWPVPKVDSAIIKISPCLSNYAYSEKRDLFFKIVKAGFCQPRKQLINNFSKSLKLDKEKVKKWLLKNKIQPAQRAETLNLKNWISLTETYFKGMTFMDLIV